MRYGLSLALLSLAFTACRAEEEPRRAVSPADSATAAMDALADRPDQDSVRMEGDRYAGPLAGPARTVTVTLGADGNAELRTDYGATRTPAATPGAWVDEGNGLISTRFEDEEMMWRRTDDSLVAIAYNTRTYGREGLRLARVRE